MNLASVVKALVFAVLLMIDRFIHVSKYTNVYNAYRNIPFKIKLIAALFIGGQLYGKKLTSMGH